VDVERLLSEDRQRVWHPYAPMPALVPPLPITAAEGVSLRLADGRDLVDGMSSWWAAVHGYGHPVLDAAIRDQLGAVSHVMFGGLTHAPAVDLARTLVEITPAGLEHVFFADSGSVSVEVAIKMCLQYQRSRGRAGKHRLMTWRGGYHGDTFGAMSVCDPDGGMHALWTGVLPAQVFADAPPPAFDPAYDAHLWAVADAHADELAGIVVEPVVQGAGGMRFHDPRHLVTLRAIADAHDLPLVFDEIATGFGRTGALFAADLAGVAPDVMCLGKALTGGYLTMAAALCTTAVAEAISGGEGGGLMHGPTFMANPLATSVALASTGLLESGEWRDDVKRIEGGLQALHEAREHPGVKDVRVKGAIGVVELDRIDDLEGLRARFVEEGVFVRPFGSIVYLTPAFTISAEELARLMQAVVNVLNKRN
jgi:adenosylmethionine---8-amino-7-oxononanoate aminotransferase